MDDDRRRCKEDTDTGRKSNHNFAAQSHRCGKGGGAEATRPRVAKEFLPRSELTAALDTAIPGLCPVWRFTEPFEQDGA